MKRLLLHPYMHANPNGQIPSRPFVRLGPSYDALLAYHLLLACIVREQSRGKCRTMKKRRSMGGSHSPSNLRRRRRSRIRNSRWSSSKTFVAVYSTCAMASRRYGEHRVKVKPRAGRKSPRRVFISQIEFPRRITGGRIARLAASCVQEPPAARPDRRRSA